MKAVVLTGKGKTEILDVEKPVPEGFEILVKVHAAALNPTDYKHVDAGHPSLLNTIVGCDYAGVVEAVGPDVGDVRRIGDRVAGLVHGSSSPRSGAFAEYLVIDARVALLLADDMSFEDASTLGVSCFTVCQMLWQSQNLPTPSAPAKEPIPFLIWSGATATANTLIQVAHLCGLQVIVTANPKHEARLKALGADKLFDYRDPDVGKKIHEYTGGKLAHAGVCEADAAGTKALVEAFGDQGGVVSAITLLQTEGLRGDIKFNHSLGYTLMGKPLKFPIALPAFPEHAVAAAGYAKLLSQMLAEHKLKTQPIKVLHGLESVAEAMDYMRSGKISGEKIVFKLL